MAHHIGPAPQLKQFVLCFDGTGNKFAGDESDSNVLKIFRVCLDSPFREEGFFFKRKKKKFKEEPH